MHRDWIRDPDDGPADAGSYGALDAEKLLAQLDELELS